MRADTSWLFGTAAGGSNAGGDAERGSDPHGTATREPQVGRLPCTTVTDGLSKRSRAVALGADEARRHDSTARAHERRGERTGTGAGRHDEVTGLDGGLLDEQCGPVISKVS